MQKASAEIRTGQRLHGLKILPEIFYLLLKNKIKIYDN